MCSIVQGVRFSVLLFEEGGGLWGDNPINPSKIAAKKL
jgi:hypothetical protein